MAPLSSKAPKLVGQLDSAGIARLEIDPVYMLDRSEPAKSLKTALDDASGSSGASIDTTSESTSEEDYDALQQDPMAVVKRGKGGGFVADLDGADARGFSTEKVYEALKASPSNSRSGPKRLKSIPITLNKLQEKGGYILTADDDALREVLKSGLERERDPTLRKRSKFSDLAFTRRFTAFDRQNEDSAGSPFRGFFTLFWLGTAIYMIQLAAENWRQYGNILGTNEIMSLMFQRDVMVLGISDGIMCASTGFGLALQKIISRGFVSWAKVGWLIQSLWEILFLLCILQWTLFREWPWTHTVFFVLHGLVMLMKQHSYAFYNGHLSCSYKTRATLRRKLEQLDDVALVETPLATTPKVCSLSASYLEQRPTASELNQRRQNKHTNSQEDGASSNLSQVAAAIESGSPLDVDQVHTFKRIIDWEIDALTEDLKGKCTSGGNVYPSNLTILNHYEYIVLPTLVYELEYPRSDQINWYYVSEKAVAVFGVLGIMNLVSQAFIYPVVVRTLEMKDAGMPLQERLEVFPWILSDLLFPFMMEYMMTWYVIWECILNLLAELTYFADREFYSSWWNSVSWEQYARDWNRPVHNFLLRHVYHSSISTLRVNKYTATLITFFLSACVHELVMWCLFKKLRGYLLALQMSQLPLMAMSRTRWMKGRATLGNLIFWIGIFTGPSLLCSLYLII